MPIRFSCAHCHKLLSIGSHKAGAEIFCPVCAGPLTVPTAAPTKRGADATLAPPKPGVTPIGGRSIALAIGFVVLLVGGLAAVGARRQAAPESVSTSDSIRVVEFDLEESPRASVVEFPDKPLVALAEPLAPPSDPQPKQLELQPVPTTTVKVEAPSSAAPALPKFQPSKLEHEPVAKVAPKPVAEPEPLPALFRVKVTRRHTLTDEELRKQLLAAPALTLDPTAQAGVFSNSNGQANRKPVEMTANLLKQRPDLAGLAVRMGNDCRLGKEAAENLQVLSRKLRDHLTAVAKNDDPWTGAEQLRRALLETERKRWVQVDALPTLEQMLQVENKPVRLLLVEMLTLIPDPSASVALARRALYDLSADVREAAIQALVGRAKDEYRALLIEGLRYPWAPVADHAAEALVAIEDRGAVTQLLKMVEQPDATSGFVVMPPPRRTAGPNDPPGLSSLIDRPTLMVREMVRINHLGNCMMCHAQSSMSTDLVRGLVPDPSRPIPTTAPYYTGDSGIFVRADMTYLRQDFSTPQPVEKPGPWPQQQRYDYLVRVRLAVPADVEGKVPSRQREALLYALNQLEPDWKGQRDR